MITNNKEILYYEKYRPQRIEDIILPSQQKTRLQELVNSKNITNMLFTGQTPGTGKTSTVNAIIRESGLESMFINASLENGIDILRGKIKNFASQESFNDGCKIVILDEADQYTDSAQGALRGFIEEFSINCRFILTCNYKNKIIEPIINRLEVFDFDEMYNDKSLIKEIFNRLKYILENENIEYQDEQLLPIIKQYYPSIRGMIGFIQKNTVSNKLIYDKIEDISSTYSELINLIKSKQYESLMQKCYTINNSDGFYTYLFKEFHIPQVIVVDCNYQFQSFFVIDKKLNLAACCTELASAIK